MVTGYKLNASLHFSAVHSFFQFLQPADAADKINTFIGPLIFNTKQLI